MAENIDATFKIGLLGPSRVGKTSLVTALLAESRDQLRGSGVTMRPVGRDTEAKLVQNRQDLEGAVLSGEFSSVSLRSTMEPFTFRLKLDPGVPGTEINIELLDFPGGWLEVGRRPVEATADWESARSFITNSTILLIPVDAALLMEATEAKHWQAVSRLLTIAAVESVARDWAIERKQRELEPALLAFCPVKCESYFSDNGGYKNGSKELEKRFRETYASVIKAVRDEAPLAAMLYVPVDTIGCVEIIDAAWPGNPDAGLEFAADYRIREPKRISRVGVDDLMRAVCKQLVDGRRAFEARHGDALTERAEQQQEYATRDEGFIRNLWLLVSRERRVRERAALDASEQAQQALRRVDALDSRLKQIAAARFGPRVVTL
jgi:GTPase SAR1 family protein